MMRVPYDQTYRPPFPALTIVLHSDDERLGPLPALLDSGADVSLIPTGLLEQINAAEGGEAYLRSHFGERQVVPLYLVSIQVSDQQLPALYVVGDDTGNEIILGRDVLNKLPLFLDGPQQHCTVLDEATVKRWRARRKG
ncbi:MAG: retroviral-like aspartic protease family protein [Chloroflexota bacterium]